VVELILVAVARCSKPVEVVDRGIAARCSEFVEDGFCGAIPMLSHPVESHALAAYLALRARREGRSVARKFSIEVLTKLVACRQISEIIGNYLPMLDDGKIVVIAVGRRIDVDRALDAVRNLGCVLDEASIDEKKLVEYVGLRLRGIPRTLPRLGLTGLGSIFAV